MVLFEQADLDQFRSIVGCRLGLQFDNGKNDLLADVLLERLQVHGYSNPAPYLASISSGADEEWPVLAKRLTVTETYFFRGTEQFRALGETAIPERTQACGVNRKLRILSAGCSSGEEPYSIAILFEERFPTLDRGQVEILGFDLNPDMIAKAKNARYHAWSLRETASDLRAKYFRKEGADFVVWDNIRSAVSFEEQNLAAAGFASLGQFDIILCRNVIMYLLPSLAQRVVGRLTEMLLPGGFLFLGYAETLRGLSHDFHLRHTHDTFYYQKVEEAGHEAKAMELPQPFAVPPVDLPDIAWLDAVQRASERIDSLARASGDVPEPERTAGIQATEGQHTSLQPASEMSLAFELLRQEKFSQALEMLQSLPPGANSDPDTRLLKAGLLTNCGEVEAAETVCRQILHADDLNAGAHYLTALCRERSGDPDGAMEHDRAAIYLDGTFAMPHLHLGRLAQRCGDLATARRELDYACLLLLREDASRLLLFGGGFNREALVAFSRAELRACGGSA